MVWWVLIIEFDLTCEVALTDALAGGGLKASWNGGEEFDGEAPNVRGRAPVDEGPSCVDELESWLANPLLDVHFRFLEYCSSSSSLSSSSSTCADCCLMCSAKMPLHKAIALKVAFLARLRCNSKYELPDVADTPSSVGVGSISRKDQPRLENMECVLVDNSNLIEKIMQK